MRRNAATLISQLEHCQGWRRRGAAMTTSDDLLVVEIMYHHVDRVGLVPQLNEPFPCDEAPSGFLLVVEKMPIIRAGRPVGWTIKGLL